ncbi:MAG: amidohydrolase [Thermodesulfobacteriota bacterium]
MNENSFDLVVTNGILLTMDSRMTLIRNGAVGISESVIRFVGKESELPKIAPKRVINAHGGIIMPGLVNTHTHLPMSIFRGLADDLPLDTWLNSHIFPAEKIHIRPETVRLGTLLSCSEMLLSGTTTCCDGYFYEDSVAEAVVETGLRAVLGHGIIDFPAPGVPDPETNLHNALSFVTKWKDRYPPITPSIFCHSPYTCSSHTLTSAKSAAKDHGILFQIHAAESKREWDIINTLHQTTPVRYLDSLDLLDDYTLLVHAIWMDKEEIALLAAKGSRVSHNPESNMKLGSGIAPIPELIKAGVSVGIGTDGSASNNNLDLFSEMDTAAKLHKVAGKDPTLMDAETVVRMATINGARTVGLEDRIGSLEPGKEADLIVLNSRSPRLVPLYSPYSSIVYAAQGSDVRHVIIAGREIVRDGILMTTDMNDILDEMTTLGDAIRRSGPYSQSYGK